MAGNAESAVTVGALRQIYNGQPVGEIVLQCLQIKQLQSRNSSDTERYRTVFSDINNFIQSMLATGLNDPLINSGKLKKGSFVRIRQFQTNEVKGKKIMVITDADVVEELGERDKIGTPEALEAVSGSAEDGGVKMEEDQKQPGAIASNNFYGNKPQPQVQQQHSLPSRTNGTSSSSHGNIYPIEALSPYAHKWTIKVRCTNKSDIKTWHKQTGEGKLFSANFLDETGEIRATGFNNECDMLYDLIQENHVYYISSPCQVKLANKKFSNLNNDYELTFERDTVVEKAEDTDGVPKVKYNFTDIAALQTVEKESVIDVIGILKEVGEVSQIVGKTSNKPFDKRELTLVDNTNFSVRLTIWGSSAQSFDVSPDSVVAFKGVKVSDFSGRSLSLLSSGSMSANPDIDEAHKLKGWYDAQGRSDTFTSHAQTMGAMPGGGRTTQYKTIQAVKDEQLGMSEEAQYFTLKATVVYIKSQDSVAYPACQSEGCNKKVTEVDPGQWRCERCDKSFPRPDYRYILQVSVSDYTGTMWLSCFDESARIILGTDANTMMDMKENDDKAYQDKIQEANCRTWVFRCRAKMDTFQEQQRVRYQVSSCTPVNYTSESHRLAEILKQYKLDDDNSSLFVQ